ncbi:hypothetical protein SAMN05421504_10790 [Amycolatopsis xylanica]|uniref:Uncharacterized protein n=1 Tax=Amycolatopsis xylanica TaxID=589385 RepID=A0A1H3N198_9PSEU|nr:hypothetical protein [Amycolatopsis xylanica]SDY82697.1 hypothetical protein SAMN05421504_10790 [Amycolatopsis xylanica]
MLRLGIFLAVIGFGSVGFHYSDYQFKILMWAEDYQPAIGSIVGVVGVLFVVAAVVMNNKKKAAAAQQAPLPQQPAQP